MPTIRRTNFANPDVDTQCWYVAARSSEVRAGAIASYSMLHRRIAIYRDAGGAVHAMDGACPHLGADLGQGTVINGGVRCAFHHWTVGADGACRSAPGYAAPPERRARVYPVEERWGLVFLFNGPEPLFPLPALPDEARYRVFLPRPQNIRCHPHLVVGNGLDTGHLAALHGMRLTAPPAWETDGKYQVRASVQGRPHSARLRWLTGSRNGDITANFTACGGNLALATVHEPVRFHTLFTGQPDGQGGCRTQVVLFLPRGINTQPLRALGLMYVLLHRDREILERLHFTGDFAEGDAALAALADAVNRLPVW